jgi:hypothetical protein
MRKLPRHLSNLPHRLGHWECCQLGVQLTAQAAAVAQLAAASRSCSACALAS